ncbi:MAG: DUF2786 domain-containing protein [Pirellulaceae bacterium]
MTRLGAFEFIWHDGGRANCGFVGYAGDCVVRSVAIATGKLYRDVYDAFSERSSKTARHGVTQDVVDSFLSENGWKSTTLYCRADVVESYLPKGVVLVRFEPREDSRKRHGHVSCVIDHTVYDTWNPFEESNMMATSFWTCADITSSPIADHFRSADQTANQESQLTQREYERILNRVKALHRTASNHASTEGEIRNALRAMQALMLQHNLQREDITDDQDVGRIGMTRRACPLNGSRCCGWESGLANYLTDEVFPTVQFYQDRCGHRSLFWFYGPVSDVEQIIPLFQEMLLTIAATAKLKFGGYARGSGASYAEGYVNGLPRRSQSADDACASDAINVSAQDGALVDSRALAVTSAARDWLGIECDIRLQNVRSTGRYRFDNAAHQQGQRDGAKHEYTGPHSQKRIGFQSDK